MAQQHGFNPAGRLITSDTKAVDRRIRAFLAGQTHGEDVFEALYGKVADEPVPDRLRTPPDDR